MERNRKWMTVLVIALLLSVVSVGIAFAAMSQTLTIDGAGEFNPADWSVKFNTDSLQKTTTGEASATTPTIAATTIGTYSVTLTKPGDSITYTFIVENNGSLDAIIEAFSKPDPQCSASGSQVGATATDDEDLICNNLIYTLTNNTAGGTSVATGQTLAKKSGTPTQQTMILHIEYPSTMQTVPTDDVTITFPQVIITYEQN